MMDDYTDIYDGVQVDVREVVGGRLGGSPYAAGSASGADAHLNDIEQRLRWVRESWAQLEARTAALERDQQVRRDAAAVREALAVGAAFSDAMGAIYDGKTSAITPARARADLWRLEQAGRRRSGQSGKDDGAAWERAIFGR
jgi:hypothetical protein